ncbi:MAG: transposase [Rhabdochlamydiaceae bacterium]|nr:transposase [Candidatus Amphrikana amoebophyrae]
MSIAFSYTFQQARIGCKGNEKYWYGYKRNLSVCRKFGLISKVAVTPANVTDSQALKHLCPEYGLVFADKGYCDKFAGMTIKT